MTQLTHPDRTATTPGHLLDHPTELTGTDLSTMHGFGGLHGGLLLGLLTATLSAEGSAGLSAGSGSRALRYVTAQFLRPAVGAVELVSAGADIGRSLTRVRGRATAEGRDVMTASAVFGHFNAAGTNPAITVPMPDVDPPDECDAFAIPTEFVPFAQHIEIRPTDAHRPYIGGRDATLTAWIRMIEDDAAPDAFRLVTLLDALAPSYAAVLDQPIPIPTVELSVRISSRLEHATSPWILLRATTLETDGHWVDERIDAWTPAGDFVGAATQVRLVQA